MSETSNQTKARLLGEPYGTATNKLRKLLLFEFVKKLNLDTCYRCNTRIIRIEEFSIEHTIPWQGSDNPVDTFYDITKIAFSHLYCNVRAGEHNKKYSSIREKVKARDIKRFSNEETYQKFLEHKRKYYSTLSIDSRRKYSGTA